MTGRQVLDSEDVRRHAASLAAIAVPRRTPMLHELWLRACASALGGDGGLELISAGESEHPVAGAIFARRGGGPAMRLSLLGTEELWEPADVFYADSDGAGALARAVIARGLPVRFGHFPADSPFVTALKRAAPRRAMVLADPVPGSPFIALDASWREPESKFSSRKRRDIRRKRRKAEALGNLTTEITAPAPSGVDTLLEEAIAVEAASWKGRSRTALAFDVRLRDFFRTYARLAAEAGILRFTFLRIDGRPIAVQIGVISDGACWQLKIGYDERHRDFSPGFLMMLEILRDAAERELDTFEFLGRSAPWTRQWTDTERPNVRLRVYPYSARGGVVLASDAALLAGRRARSWLGARLGGTRVRADGADE